MVTLSGKSDGTVTLMITPSYIDSITAFWNEMLLLSLQKLLCYVRAIARM